MQQEHEVGQDAEVTSAKARAGLRLPTPGNRTRLVLASALMLFVELALIRWTSSNNLYLVHMTNFVLLASFLGIGLGFLRAKAARDLFPLAPILLAVLVAFVLVFPVRTGTGRGGQWQLVGMFDWSPLPRWLSLTVIFVLTVATLMALAQEVARTFATLRAARGLPAATSSGASPASCPSRPCRSSGCRRSGGACSEWAPSSSSSAGGCSWCGACRSSHWAHSC